MISFRLSCLYLSLATLLVSAPLIPVNYSLPNGQGTCVGGSFDYFDESYSGIGSTTTCGAALSGGLGQLTDGITTPNTDWQFDYGDGPAFRWVGWLDINPVIVFDFGFIQNFATIRLFTNNSQSGGVFLWTSTQFEFSDDGITYTPGVTRTPSPAENADTTARFIDTAVSGNSGRYVRVSVGDSGGSAWTFLSEIAFDSATADVPEPNSVSIVALGLAGVIAFRWLRRSSHQ